MLCKDVSNLSLSIRVMDSVVALLEQVVETRDVHPTKALYVSELWVFPRLNDSRGGLVILIEG